MCGPTTIRMGSLHACSQKSKVVVVMGATGTGKSRLAIDLALRFDGEVVNSDKMQVYAGLDIVTNKVTDEERSGVPHHLLGIVPPDAEFTASDFRREAAAKVAAITGRGRLAIVAGGSNSYVEELVEGGGREFLKRYDCCFLWVDVAAPVLHAFVAARVDDMVERGMVEEVRGFFDPADADYSRGIRRAIGVPELDRYLRAEAAGQEAAPALLDAAIDEIKANTCKLTCCQLEKIRRLSGMAGWDVRRIDATEVFRMRGAEADVAWEEAVSCPGIKIVREFLNGELDETKKEKTTTTTSTSTTTATTTTTTTTATAAIGNEIVANFGVVMGKAGLLAASATGIAVVGAAM